MTSEQTTIMTVEQRLLDALHAAQVRRERFRRREKQRNARWLSRFDLERHHLRETRPDEA